MNKLDKFKRGMKAGYSTKRRAFASLTIAVSVFILMNLAARPIFAQQMLAYEIYLLPETVRRIFLFNSSNELQMFFTLAYAFLTGPALVLMYFQFQTFGSSVKDLASIAPGILASGCVGCGAGVIGLLGLTGALAPLPFNGLLITPAATVMLVYFITKSGNPEVCNLK
jgi:hypothetical protein